MTLWPPVAIAVATFQRPAGLESLLNSLAALRPGVDFDVIVVDNDPERSAEQAAANSPLNVTYVVENEPGIVAARNRALSLTREYHFVVFVDDDETVEPDWLHKLLEAQSRYDCDLVSGPVHYEFDVPPPRWAVLGGFYTEPGFAEGEQISVAATNNLLVARGRVERFGELRFDPRFGLTGGSDIMLTKSLASRGANIRWTNRAVVRERVPAVRTTRAWLVRRAIRSGNTDGRVQLVLSRESGERIGRARVAFAGIARLLSGIVLAPAAPWCNASVQVSQGFRRALRGVGMIRAVIGAEVVEYKRTSPDVP